MLEPKAHDAQAYGGADSEALQLVGLYLSKHVPLVLAVQWFIYTFLSSDPGNECIMSIVWKIV